MTIDSIVSKKVFDNIEALQVRRILCVTQIRVYKANNKFKRWLAALHFFEDLDLRVIALLALLLVAYPPSLQITFPMSVPFACFSGLGCLTELFLSSSGHFLLPRQELVSKPFLVPAETFLPLLEPALPLLLALGRRTSSSSTCPSVSGPSSPCLQNSLS